MKYILFGCGSFVEQNPSLLPPNDEILAYSYSNEQRATSFSGEYINGKAILSINEYPSDYDYVLICSGPKSCMSIFSYLQKNGVPLSKIKFIEDKNYLDIYNFVNRLYADISNKLSKLSNKVSVEFTKSMRVHELHSKVFPKYRNINLGKEVVIVGSGPTLSSYKKIKNACHIGVNSVVRKTDLLCEVLFFTDYQSIKDNKEYICKYDSSTHFFYGLPLYEHEIFIPEVERLQVNAENFYISTIGDVNEKINYDLSCETLPCFCSVIFSALAFALWTHPKRIYLVGCDCTMNEHFDGSVISHVNEDIIRKCFNYSKVGWVKFKKFCQFYYPDVEIVSINPVGLRGFFNDEFTR